MLWLKTAVRLVWESIGKKWVGLPAALALAVALRVPLPHPLPGIDIAAGPLVISALDQKEIVAGPVSIPGNWVVAAAIIVCWLTLGLLIKAVRLQMAADLDPIPDMPGQEVFQHVMLRSKWVLGQEPNGGKLYDAVDRQIGTAARLGRLKVWGEPRQGMAGGYPARPREISPERWDSIHFDLPSCISNEPGGALLIDHSNKADIIYENIKMNQRQVFNIWPTANWLERFRDSTWKKRRDFLRKEQAHYALVQGPKVP